MGKKSFIVVALLPLLIAQPAVAQPKPDPKDVQAKLCILSAAQKLPVIPGLVITASRNTIDRGDPNSSTVELDFKAAAQDGTFSYACGWAAGKPTVVTLIGLAR
jgi:hypothetical protein